MAPDRRRRLEDITTAELAPLEQMFAPGYPETWIDVARVLYVELLNQGLATAAQLAHSLTEAMREEIGGQRLYMTRGVFFEARLRARQISDEFDGRNLALLARKHRLSAERVRQIVRDQLQAQRHADAQQLADLQPQLPWGAPDPEAS